MEFCLSCRIVVGIYCPNAYMTYDTLRTVPGNNKIVECLLLLLLPPVFRFILCSNISEMFLGAAVSISNSSSQAIYLFYSFRGDWSRDSRLFPFPSAPDAWSLVGSYKASLEQPFSAWETQSILINTEWNQIWFMFLEPQFGYDFPCCYLTFFYLKISSFLSHMT